MSVKRKIAQDAEHSAKRICSDTVNSLHCIQNDERGLKLGQQQVLLSMVHYGIDCYGIWPNPLGQHGICHASDVQYVAKRLQLFLVDRRVFYEQLAAQCANETFNDDKDDVYRESMREDALYCWRTVEMLSDVCIDLYVAQSIDWMLAVRHMSPQNLCGPRRDCLFALALAALLLVVKQHHADTHQFLLFNLQNAAKALGTDSKLFKELERALLVAVDYNPAVFIDSVNAIDSAHRCRSVIEDADWTRFEGDVRLQQRFAAINRRIIVDHCDQFARFSPIVRGNAAAVVCLESSSDSLARALELCTNSERL